MKLRNSILTVGILATLFANTVFALGLGEFKLNSSLNEPLDMEIQLLNVGELTELEMLAGLGSRADFERADVERLFLLTDLHFKIDLSKPGQPIIRVTSRKPIREPYLDFLIELQWSTGRLLREYTLLLDMPLYATESPSTKKIEAAGQSSQLKVQPSRQEPTKTASPALSLAAGDGEYKVGLGDTVWAIAKRIKPSDASMYQTMAAIKQYNPQAFINDNINLLKKGAIIRLPEGRDIASLSHDEAVSDIVFETAALDDSQEATAAQLDASDDVEEPSTTEETRGGQLKLATLDQNEALMVSGTGDNTSGAGTADGNDSDITQNDLSVVQEELDKTQRENTELKARLANLEEQVATMNRLVEINDDSLRATQLSSLQASELDDVSPAGEVVDPKVDTPEATVVSRESTKKELGFDLAAWMDVLLSPLIALLAILLAVLLFFRNRKQVEDEPYEITLRTLVGEPELTPEPEIEDVDGVLSEKELEVLAEAAPEFDEQELKEFEKLELAEGEGVDPAGEADIYLSLGNYNQAEVVLANAIDKDPSNTSQRLKLLEVYVNVNDLEKFDAQRLALAELNDADADAKAASLRLELAPEPLAGEPDEKAPGSDGESAESSVEVRDVEPNASAPEISSVTESGFDLNLDLDDADLDALSSGIDVDVGDLDFDETAVEPKDATAVLETEATSGKDDPSGGGVNDLDIDLKAIGGSDECATKLDLAEAYIDMGEISGARDILDEVIAEGSEAQQERARELLEDAT
jgi:pilus assembly protein FimV